MNTDVSPSWSRAWVLHFAVVAPLLLTLSVCLWVRENPLSLALNLLVAAAVAMCEFAAVAEHRGRPEFTRLLRPVSVLLAVLCAGFVVAMSGMWTAALIVSIVAAASLIIAWLLIPEKRPAVAPGGPQALARGLPSKLLSADATLAGFETNAVVRRQSPALPEFGEDRPK